MKLFKSCAHKFSLKMAIKASEKLLLAYSSLISVVQLVLKVLKASRNLLFLVYSATFLILSYFCNTKNVCPKNAEGCFLGYWSTFVTQKCVFKTSWGCFLGYLVTFVVQKMYVQIKGGAFTNY